MLETGVPRASASPFAGLLIQDPIARRLVESSCLHLELTPEELTLERVTSAALHRYELLIADKAVAGRLHELLMHPAEAGDGAEPALIVLEPPDQEPDSLSVHAEGSEYDGALTMPLNPATLSAQLGVLLYAHRTFVRRYQTAMDELHLNRRIFRSVTSGISVANASLPDLPLVYVNPAFEVMTGYSLEEVAGRNCRFLQGSETDQPAVTLLREAIRDQREVVVVLRNFRKDGTAFWNELSLSPIFDREGVLTHFVGIQTDVTARVEFEAALRESEKLAAVGRLASSIAHEINNPLESVMNLLYLAQRVDSEEERSGYLSAADKELQRVSLITSQSLRFYKQSTRPQATRPRELIDSVLNLYESRVENSHVHLERRDRATTSIICLESEIRQVLNNLVRNAIDAMHGRGGRLLIRSRDAVSRDAGEGEIAGVLLTIADTGGGISAATQSSLYRPFFTTKGAAGTGLGLWISKEIVHRHHGTLQLRSSQQTGRSGTVFELFLPLQPPLT